MASSADLLASVYSGAATIAKPLSLSAFAVSCLTLVIRQIVTSLERPLKQASSEAAVEVIKSAMRYIFIVAVIALVGGLLCYVLEFFLQDYVKKYAMIGEAREAKLREDPVEIKRYAASLMRDYPSDPEGYHYEGIADFYARNYGDAALYFNRALDKLSRSDDLCEEKHRSYEFDLAAAQAAAGNYANSLASMDKLGICWNEKIELLNYAKIELMNKRFDDADKILSSSNIVNGLPDFTSEVALELGFLSMIRKEAGWVDHSTQRFKQAILHDHSYAQLIICGDTSSKLNSPGMIGEYQFELMTLADSANSSFVRDMRSKLRGAESC